MSEYGRRLTPEEFLPLMTALELAEGEHTKAERAYRDANAARIAAKNRVNAAKQALATALEPFKLEDRKL
jgi:hypothetical protein